MITLLTALALQAAPPARSNWIKFDHRESGFGSSDFMLDWTSMRANNGVVNVWITYNFYFSGRNPVTSIELRHIDCANRTARIATTIDLDGSHHTTRSLPSTFEPFNDDDTNGLLAGPLCQQFREGVD